MIARNFITAISPLSMLRLIFSKIKPTTMIIIAPINSDEFPSVSPMPITNNGSQAIVTAAPMRERPLPLRIPKSWTKIPQTRMIREYPSPVSSGPPSIADCKAGQASQVAAASIANAENVDNFSILSSRCFNSASTASCMSIKPSIPKPPLTLHIRISVRCVT